MTEFEKKTGDKLSLVQYYAGKYNKTLRDLKQPLIISVPPLREQRSGNNTGPLYLVPELCNMTGLSDEQRANFKLMQVKSDYCEQSWNYSLYILNYDASRIWEASPGRILSRGHRS